MSRSLFRKGQLRKYWVVFLSLSVIASALFAFLVMAFGANEGNTVVISSPANNSFNRTANTLGINFTCSANDVRGTFINFSLVGNFSGAGFDYYRGNTTNVTINSTFSFNITLADGHYNWSCAIVNESAGINATVNISNVRVVIIDTTVPSINFINASGNQNSNGNWSGQSDVAFYVNATDANTGTGSCTVYTNVSNGGGLLTNRSNVTFSYTSNALSASAAQMFADGSYMFNVTCNDSANNRNNSYGAAIIFNVDSVAPTVAISGPTNASFNNSASVRFQFTVTDSNLANCSLYSNASIGADNMTVNYSASAAALAAEGYNFSLVNVHDGSYKVNVSCTDSAGNYTRNASFWTVNIDTAAPVINFINATGNQNSNGNWSAQSDVVFYVNATDANTGTGSCTVYTNVSNGGGLLTNRSNVTFSYTPDALSASAAQIFADGSYMFNVTCNDSASNRDSSYGTAIIFNVDAVAPTVAISGPTNASFNNSASVRFQFTVTDNNLANCSLYSNASIGSDNMTINYSASAAALAAEGYNFSLVNVHDGSYKVNVSCTDSAGNYTRNASFWTVNIDTVAPVINFINATGNQNSNGNWSAQSDVAFYVNSTDLNPANCVVYTNVSNGGGLLTNRSNVTLSYTSDALSASAAQMFADGSYRFNVTCNDSASNRDSSYGTAIIFNVDAVAPTVAISGHVNDSFNTSSSIRFSFTTTDNNPANCSLWSNASGTWARNYSASSSALSAEGYNFTLVNMHDGSYHANITCSDSAGNFSLNSTYRTIHIDTTSPLVFNMTPNASSIIQALNSSNFFIFTITEANLNRSGTNFANFSIVWRKSSPTTSAWQNETGGNLNTMACIGSGVAARENCTASLNLGALDSGEGTVIDYYVRVADLAGNYNSNGTAETPNQVKLDKAAPVINFINSSGYALGLDLQNWTNSNDPTFYVNVTENNTDSCVVYSNMTGSWGANTSYNFLYTSTALSSSGSVTADLHDGSYWWNVTCNDSSGRQSGYRGGLMLNIDTVSLVVLLNSSNNTYNQSGNINLLFTVIETNQDSCTLYTNMTGSFAANKSATSSEFSASGYNFSLLGLHDGGYLWNVKCNDSANNAVINSTNQTFTIDTVSPALNSINATGYNSGTAANALQNWTSSNDPTFYVNVTEDNSVYNASCTLYTNMTGSWAANSSYVFGYTTNALTSSGSVTADLHDGSYRWNMTCNDSASRLSQYGASGIVLNIDSTPPTIAVQGPQNLSYNSSASVSVRYSLTENNLVNCSLWTNATGSWERNQTTNATWINASQTNNTFVLADMHDATYKVNVSCTDMAGSDSASATDYTFTIDTTAPVFSNPRPANNTVIVSGTNIVFNITVTERNINTSASPSTSFPIGGGVRAYFKDEAASTYNEVNLTCSAAPTSGDYYCSNTTVNAGLADGNILLYFFNVSDNGGLKTNNGSTTSPLRVSIDEITPVINYIASSANDTNFANAGGNWTASPVTFYVNVTDSNPAQCVIYTNASPATGNNLTGNATLTYTSNALSPSSGQVFADGSYRMNATCNDSATRVDGSYGQVIVFNVDSTSPAVLLTAPLDGSVNRSSTLNINVTFSVTENNLDACSLYTNYSGVFAKNYTANASQLSAQGYNFSFVGARDGRYVWNVRCNDTASNTGLNSTNYTLTIDTTAPVINSLNSTGWNRGNAGDNWSNSASISFYANVTDANADSCTVYTNASGGLETNSTNTTFSYTSNALAASSAQIFADGSYRFNVSCNDSGGNRDYSFSGNSSVFNVDTVSPIVAINSPLNSTYNASGTVKFLFTVTENNLDTCSLYSNATGSWAFNYSAGAAALAADGYNFSLLAMHDGSYRVNITCNDSAAGYSSNASFFTVSVDTTAPVINYLNQTYKYAVSLGNFSDNGNITFHVNVSDNNAGQCVIFTNSSPATGNNLSANVTVSFTNGAITSTSSQVFGDGDFRWNATCNDSAGNVDSSYGSVALFSVDTVMPIVAISKPVNNTINTTSAIVNITFTATENNLETCSLFTNESGSWSLNHVANKSEFTAGHGFNLSFRPAIDGSYQVNITCNDSGGRISQNSSTFVVNIDANSPTVNFINATGYNNNGNRSAGRTLAFYMNATDTSPDKCVVYTNMTGSWAANDSTLFGWTSNALNATASISVSADSHILWNVECNDTANNKGVNPANHTLRIDTQAPRVKLVNPVNASVNSTQAVVFEYNVTDEAAGETHSCQIYGSALGTALELKYTNMSISASDSFDRETVIHPSGVRHWNVRCNDTAGNIGWNSTNLTFTVETGDVNINYSQTLTTRGWNTLWVPTTTIMGTFGMTSGNTQNWNISYVFSTRGKLNSNYNVVYYNVDGTDSGWRSFNRNDWAGSSLQYISNVNDKPYWINTSASNVTFSI